jgi:6-phosphogluconolactonase
VREIRVYVGTYTSNGGKGIYLYSLDAETGALRLVKTVVGVVNPSFLALTPDRRFLYAVNEVDAYYGKPEGALSAFAVDPQSGDLRFLNQQSSKGAAPCHLSFDGSGRYVFVANYGGGCVAVFPIEPDGKLGAAVDHVRHRGSGMNPERQAGPHAHCIMGAPGNGHVLAVDLGLDKILAYSFDAGAGKLAPSVHPSTNSKPGSGPRDLIFHPNGRWAYVIHELESLITVYAYDAEKGTLRERQTRSSLPDADADMDVKGNVSQKSPGENYGACLQTDPRGRFLYASNRGHDSIVHFRIDAEDGSLAFAGWVPTGGRFPRHFSLDPEGRFLLVGNQRSDSLVVFRIDPETGAPIPTGFAADVPSPVCVLAINSK